MLVTTEARITDADATSATPAISCDVKFDRHDAFQVELKRRVDEHFKSIGKSPRDCWQMYVKTVVILTWFLLSYVVLVFIGTSWWITVPAAMSLGLSMAAIGFSIQHDGGHHAYSRFPIVNRLASLTLDMLGGSSYYWARKHNSIHHTYANITGHDDDIELGVLGRLSPHQKRYGIHRLQHLYLWFLYGFITTKWQFFDDYRDFVTRRIGGHAVSRPTGKDAAIFFLGKAFFVTMALGVPMMLHPWTSVLLCYFCVSFFQGVTLSVIFQLAHCVEEAEFPMPEKDTGRMNCSFAVHQIQTTVNFAPNNRLLSWFVGGLNYQIEHHLFPRICHIHYRSLAPVVQATCKDFGVRYSMNDTFTAGIASHYRWLRRMGQPENASC